MKKKYRLIWFQHFHKAAGTSIVDLARTNNEVFWSNHENGNPKDSNGNFIELWNYSQYMLKQFIDLFFLMIQGKVKELLYRMKYRKRKINSEFLNYFNAENFWDIQVRLLGNAPLKH
ncbi:MAG: hypothetical protein HQK75_19670 [Candidatus Magnetomorum sp.]|nr:hypothetical protein [Candidatus Magnetomorum sp.]